MFFAVWDTWLVGVVGLQLLDKIECVLFTDLLVLLENKPSRPWKDSLNAYDIFVKSLGLLAGHGWLLGTEAISHLLLFLLVFGHRPWHDLNHIRVGECFISRLLVFLSPLLAVSWFEYCHGIISYIALY